jgi:hypothetical protein
MRTPEVPMDCEPESLGRAVEFYSHFACLAEQREAKLGHPVTGCPTATELWSVVESFKAVSKAEESPTPSEIWALAQALAAVSDKWVDPEKDAIGAEVYDVLESTIEGLRRMLERSIPDRANELQKWSNVRVSSHCSRRTVYLQSLNPPWFTRLWRKLKIFQMTKDGSFPRR